VKEELEKTTAQRAAHKQQVPKRVHKTIEGPVQNERGHRHRHEGKRLSTEELAKALSAAVNKAHLQGAFTRESNTDHTPVDHAGCGSTIQRECFGSTLSPLLHIEKKHCVSL